MECYDILFVIDQSSVSSPQWLQTVEHIVRLLQIIQIELQNVRVACHCRRLCSDISFAFNGRIQFDELSSQEFLQKLLALSKADSKPMPTSSSSTLSEASKTKSQRIAPGKQIQNHIIDCLHRGSWDALSDQSQGKKHHMFLITAEHVLPPLPQVRTTVLGPAMQQLCASHNVAFSWILTDNCLSAAEMLFGELNDMLTPFGGQLYLTQHSLKAATCHPSGIRLPLLESKTPTVALSVTASDQKDPVVIDAIPMCDASAGMGHDLVVRRRVPLAALPWPLLQRVLYFAANMSAPRADDIIALLEGKQAALLSTATDDSVWLIYDSSSRILVFMQGLADAEMGAETEMGQTSPTMQSSRNKDTSQHVPPVMQMIEHCFVQPLQNTCAARNTDARATWDERWKQQQQHTGQHAGPSVTEEHLDDVTLDEDLETFGPHAMSSWQQFLDKESSAAAFDVLSVTSWCNQIRHNKTRSAQSVIINHLSTHLPSAQALIDRYNVLSQPQEDATPSATPSSTPLAPPSSSSARPARRLSRRRPITQQFSREPPTRSSLAPLLRQVQMTCWLRLELASLLAESSVLLQTVMRARRREEGDDDASAGHDPIEDLCLAVKQTFDHFTPVFDVQEKDFSCSAFWEKAREQFCTRMQRWWSHLFPREDDLHDHDNDQFDDSWGDSEISDHGFQRPTASAKTSAKAIAARTVKSQVLSKEEKDKIKRMRLGSKRVFELQRQKQRPAKRPKSSQLDSSRLLIQDTPIKKTQAVALPLSQPDSEIQIPDTPQHRSETLTTSSPPSPRRPSSKRSLLSFL